MSVHMQHYSAWVIDFYLINDLGKIKIIVIVIERKLNHNNSELDIFSHRLYRFSNS